MSFAKSAVFRFEMFDIRMWQWRRRTRCFQTRYFTRIFFCVVPAFEWKFHGKSSVVWNYEQEFLKNLSYSLSELKQYKNTMLFLYRNFSSCYFFLFFGRDIKFKFIQNPFIFLCWYFLLLNYDESCWCSGSDGGNDNDGCCCWSHSVHVINLMSKLKM